jgi:hypothetical protein
MKIATIEDFSPVGKDQRIIRRGVHFGFKGLANEGQGIPDGAVNLGNTAKGIGILNLGAEFMGLGNLAPLSQSTEVS